MGLNRHARSAIVVASLLIVSALSGSVATAAPRPACAVSAGVTISGGRTPTITGTEGNDTIDCRGARKGYTILGLGGADNISGGRGRDTIWGDGPSGAGTCAGADSIDGEEGNDTVRGSACGATANLGPGDDVFIAGGGINSVVGGDGNDVIDLTAAAVPVDQIGVTQARGGAGNDHIIGSAQTCIHGFGDAGNDLLDGGDGTCADLNGVTAGDRLEGGDGDDSINGNGGNDILIGDAGIDQLSGGDGDDILHDASSESDFFIGGNNDTTTAPLPRPGPGFSGVWGDVCVDADGRGTAPADPAGNGGVGSISGVQNDTLDGCEYTLVGG